jgi:predicted SAM-dependent methyltransferase
MTKFTHKNISALTIAAKFINVGSGQRPFDRKKGWTNVDIQERWNPDVVADWRSMPMFEDGSADIIVAHQTIEHVGCGEAKPFFKEAYRILKPGGSLIITVPDLKALAKRWLAGQLSDYLYFVNLMGAYMDEESDRHRWHYTFPSLREELSRLWGSQIGGAHGGVDDLLPPADRLVGFSEVKRFDWREIEGADIARDWWVLGIEVVK